MKHLVACGLALSLCLTWLQACQRKPGVERIAEPASGPTTTTAEATGALDDSPAALMAAVLRGGRPDGTGLQSVPAPQGAPEKTTLVSVSPSLVIPLDADHRMLVVSGIPTDGHGGIIQAHVTEANVGLYGFERRSGRWFRTVDRPSLTWTGFYGDAGELKSEPAGPGRAVLSILNGSCWQGQCGTWLEVYALTLLEARPLTRQLISSESDAFGCDEWQRGKPREPKEDDPPVDYDRCYAIEGRWRFESSTSSGWPDLVLSFTGYDAVHDSKTGQTVPLGVNEQLVLRDDGSSYRPLNGRNPTKGF